MSENKINKTYKYKLTAFMQKLDQINEIGHLNRMRQMHYILAIRYRANTP